MHEARVTVEIADVFIHFRALRASVRVQVDVVRSPSQLLRPVLQFTDGLAIGIVVTVAAFISEMFSPIELARKSAFALFTSISRFSIVAEMFLLPVFGERAPVHEDLVTR